MQLLGFVLSGGKAHFYSAVALELLCIATVFQMIFAVSLQSLGFFQAVAMCVAMWHFFDMK